MKPLHIIFLFKLNCVGRTWQTLVSCFLSLLVLCFSSCKKFVQIDPPSTQLVGSTMFSNEATARTALNGIYSQMMSSSGFASGGPECIGLLTGLSSDEFLDFSNGSLQGEFYSNQLSPTNSILYESLWQEPYKYIYEANRVMEGLNASLAISVPLKRQLIGEAKLVRAFCYFYLVNLFGDVPLALSSDYRINKDLPRMPVQQVYQQMVADLKDAQNLLPVDYSLNGGARTRPIKAAATALLARVYLFSGDWSGAETQASLLIDQGSTYSLTDLNSVFLKNSKEAIWQLAPVLPGYNTNEAVTFILTTPPNYVGLNPSLLQSFEFGDQRKISWVDSLTVLGKTYYYPKKYKVNQTGLPVTEYSMVLRLAEQYLIRAEARTHLNNLTGAQDDLNLIRNRAGLNPISATDQIGLLAAIEQERKVELMAEWGHRWLDLKRTGRADQVLSSSKPAWKSTAALYPVPQSERNNDVHLWQNLGY